MKEDRKAWRDLREGAYMLRTNLQADSAEQLWSKYMQLTVCFRQACETLVQKRAANSGFKDDER
jgi:hypothetical protein